jgi:hypothetical protein
MCYKYPFSSFPRINLNSLHFSLHYLVTHLSPQVNERAKIKRKANCFYDERLDKVIKV